MSGPNPPVDPHPDIFGLGQRRAVPASTRLTVGVPTAPAVRPSGVRARRSPILGYLPYIAAAIVGIAVVAAVIVPKVIGRGGTALPADVQVLGDAIHTAKSATSYHLTSTVTEEGHTIGQDIAVATGKGFKGSDSIDSQKLDLIEIGNDVYVRAGLGFWTRVGSPAAAQMLAGKWIKDTSSKLPAQVSDLVNQSQLFDRILTQVAASFTNEGPTTYHGQRAIAIGIVDHTGEEATVYVSATTPSYPIAIVGNFGGGMAVISFDNWDFPVTLVPPPGAIDPQTAS